MERGAIGGEIAPLCAEMAHVAVDPDSLPLGDVFEFSSALRQYVRLALAYECRIDTQMLVHEVKKLLDYFHLKSQRDEYEWLRVCLEIFEHWSVEVDLLMRYRLAQGVSFVRIPSFTSLNGATIVPSFDFDISSQAIIHLAQLYGYNLGDDTRENLSCACAPEYPRK